MEALLSIIDTDTHIKEPRQLWTTVQELRAYIAELEAHPPASAQAEKVAVLEDVLAGSEPALAASHLLALYDRNN